MTLEAQDRPQRRRLRQISNISESEEESQQNSVISLLSSSSDEEEDNDVIGESGGSDTEIEPNDTGKSTKNHQEKENQGQEWACRRCTFLNDPQKTICELCECRRLPSSLHTSSHQEHQTLQISKLQEEKKKKKKQQEHIIDCIDSDSDSEVSRPDHRNVIKSLPVSGPTLASYRQNTLDFQIQAAPRRQGIKRRLVKNPSFPPAAAKAEQSHDNILWIDKYRPENMEDLCIPKKKAQEIYDWLYDNTDISSTPSVHGKKRLLFLCGPPGVGKSTALRSIAKTLNIHLKEWHDATSLGRIGYDAMLKDDFVSQRVATTSTIDDLIDFMNRSVNYTALPLMTHTSTRRRCRHLSNKQPKNSSTFFQQHRQIVLIDHLPKSLLEQQHHQSTSSTSPHMKFQQLLQQHIGSLSSMTSYQYPLVIFYNEIKENARVDLKQLGRVFSDQVVLSPFTSIIQVNQVTTSQIKKILNKILNKEQKQIKQEEMDRMIENSNGDLRHAINMLQVINSRLVSQKTSTNKKKNHRLQQQQQKQQQEGKQNKEQDPEVVPAVGRDAFYSELHLVGKLVHAKKPHTTSMFQQLEASIAYSSMEVDPILAFMQENCIDHFTDIDDLSNALELFSLSSNLLSHSYTHGQNGILFQRTKDLVNSILVRSIALTNVYPAPSKFRPIRKPRVYSIIKYTSRDSIQDDRTNGSWIHRSYVGTVDAYEFDSFKQLIPRSFGKQLQEQMQVEKGLELEIEDEIEDFSE